MSNKGLNSKESFDESTATSSSVRLSGARRVKEIADRLDIQEYRTDPGNSDRDNLRRDEATPPVHRLFARGTGTKSSLIKSSWSSFSMFSLAMVATLFLLVRAEREIVCTGMTTQQKTAAIRSILTNHEDNVAVVRAAKVSAGLDAIVIEAMNAALKDDLVLIFACKPVTSANG
jgi:type IV secretory pathway ATPase VirB11/archaellum biosynthesis ATPase